MSQELYKIATNGQVSLPAPIKRDWGMEKGGNITLLDAKDALAIVPAGYEFVLVEAIYPQSELSERANFALRSDAYNNTGFDDYSTKAFATRTKVSRSGQFVLGNVVRKRWQISNGGHVTIFDAYNTAFVEPTHNATDLGISLPMDILLEDWQAKANQKLLPFYPRAYEEWCASIGHSFVQYALDGSESMPVRLELNDASRTDFGQAVGKATVQQAFLHATI